jgi:hypothetical protein
MGGCSEGISMLWKPISSIGKKFSTVRVKNEAPVSLESNDSVHFSGKEGLLGKGDSEKAYPTGSNRLKEGIATARSKFRNFISPNRNRFSQVEGETKTERESHVAQQQVLSDEEKQALTNTHREIAGRYAKAQLQIESLDRKLLHNGSLTASEYKEAHALLKDGKLLQNDRKQLLDKAREIEQSNSADEIKYLRKNHQYTESFSRKWEKNYTKLHQKFEEKQKTGFTPEPEPSFAQEAAQSPHHAPSLTEETLMKQEFRNLAHPFKSPSQESIVVDPAKTGENPPTSEDYIKMVSHNLVRKQPVAQRPWQTEQKPIQIEAPKTQHTTPSENGYSISQADLDWSQHLNKLREEQHSLFNQSNNVGLKDFHTYQQMAQEAKTFTPRKPNYADADFITDLEKKKAPYPTEDETPFTMEQPNTNHDNNVNSHLVNRENAPTYKAYYPGAENEGSPRSTTPMSTTSSSSQDSSVFGYRTTSPDMMEEPPSLSASRNPSPVSVRDSGTTTPTTFFRQDKIGSGKTGSEFLNTLNTEDDLHDLDAAHIAAAISGF